MNGEGTYVSADGKKVEGIFENDNFVRGLWVGISKQKKQFKFQHKLWISFII
jgi:hypothetical protein